MTKTTLAQHLDQLTDLVQRLICLRSRFKVEPPADLVRMRARMAELHREGKTRTDHRLLYPIGITLLRQPSPMTMGELSKTLDVPLSTATRIVSWLVKSGYVERLPDPQDRRIVRVALTEAGREMVSIGDEFIRQNIEQVLRRFTAEERESLVVLMSKLAKTLEEEENPSGK
jgi:DNA-binding MarR family transcriptional regulator